MCKRTLSAATDRRRLGRGALALGVVTLGMDNLRLIDWLTPSDVFLSVAGLCIVPEMLRSRPGRLRPVAPQLIGLTLLAAGGVLGSLLFEPGLADFVNLFKLELAMGGTMLLLLFSDFTETDIRHLCWAWVISVSVTGMVPRWVELNGVERFAGLAVHPNGLALMAVLASGVALSLYATSAGRERRLAMVCLCILGLSVLLSGSRSGLLGYLAAVTVAGARLGRKEAKVALAIVWTGVCLATSLTLGGVVDEIAPGAAIERLLPNDPSSAGSDVGRRIVLRRGLERAEEHPLTGTGFKPTPRAHNAPVEIWAGGGALALLGFGLFAAATIKPLFIRTLRARSATRSSECLLLGLASGFVGWLAAAPFQHAIWSRWLWMTPALIAALSVAITAASRADHPRNGRHERRIVPSPSRVPTRQSSSSRA